MRINERRDSTVISVSAVLLKDEYRPFPTNGLCCPCPPPIEPVLTPSVPLFLPTLQDSTTEAAAARPARPRPPSSRTTASPSFLGNLRFKRSLRLRQLLDLGNGLNVLIGDCKPRISQSWASQRYRRRLCTVARSETRRLGTPPCMCPNLGRRS